MIVTDGSLSNLEIPEFLAIGHVTKDLVEHGYRVGGAVTYGAKTSSQLGLVTAAVTSASDVVDIEEVMPDVAISVVPSQRTTTFRNIYKDSSRLQIVEGVASPITFSDVPMRWRASPLVFFGPLVGEVGPDLVRSFQDSTTLVALQGWLREWDDSGVVVPKTWDGKDVLPHVDIAVCSVEDFDTNELVDVWKDMTPILVLTKGDKGADVHFGGSWHEVPGYTTVESDPTGAGDVFAAAFLIQYAETSDPLEAARFANSTASFSVEKLGIKGIPTRMQVMQRMHSEGCG